MGTEGLGEEGAIGDGVGVFLILGETGKSLGAHAGDIFLVETRLGESQAHEAKGFIHILGQGAHLHLHRVAAG